MIRAVLFDWGGVMVEGGRWFADYVEERLNVTLADNKALSAAHSDMSAGKIGQSEFETILKESTGIEVLPDDFWWPEDLLTMIPEMHDFCQDLRERGYVTGILSNMSEVSAKKIAESGGYDQFNTLVISYSVGASKPHPKIFDFAVKKTGLRPEEIVFVDDHENNLAYPSSIGIKTVLAKNTDQIIKDINALLGEE